MVQLAVVCTNSSSYSLSLLTEQMTAVHCVRFDISGL
jgi:hypothetical protein